MQSWQRGSASTKIGARLGRIKSAELSPRAKRECMNKEWCMTLVGSKCKVEPIGKEGLNQQRVVPDFGRVKVQS